MKRKLFYSCFSIWFILVNLPQLIPILNRIEPIIIGIPFNMFWIWGLNLIMTILVIIYVSSKKNPDLDFSTIKDLVKKEGLEVRDK